MKKLFSFKTSVFGNGSNNPVPQSPSNNEKVYWEKPWENAKGSKITDQDPEHSQNPKELISCLGDQYMENHKPVGLHIRRSLSFSSPISKPGERNASDFSDPSLSPSTSGSSPHHKADFQIRLLTPERQPKPKKRSGQIGNQQIHMTEKINSYISPSDYFDSSGNSPYSSPVPLRCRAARLSHVSNETLDLYIDGEQQDRNLMSGIDFQRNSPGAGNHSCLIEHKKLTHSKCPPRVSSTPTVSPTKEKLRSYSFQGSRDSNLCPSTTDLIGDNVRLASPQKILKNEIDRLPHVFPQTSKRGSHDFDSETITVTEDIYEDCSVPYSNLNSNGISRKCFSSDNLSSCHLSDAPNETTNVHCKKDIQDFLKQSYFLGDGPVTTINDEHVDAKLRKKRKEAEERVLFLEEEFEQLKLRDCPLSIPALLQIIEKINHDRRNLAVEVSSQIQSRISERASASEAIKRAKLNLNERTKRLEKETNEMQKCLEKELDRRSSDWSFKVERYQSEEQRLRDRVRELAEQNVSLQREVSSFKGRETESKSRLAHLEVQLKEVADRIEEVRLENDNLQQTLSKLRSHCKEVEADRDCIRRSLKEKENENKELLRAVSRLKRIYGENEKTINGLREALDEVIDKQSPEKGNVIVRLQMEHVRLSGVEQALRKEVESFRLEVASLRIENINLLERLRDAQNGRAFSLIKLDQEMGARVNCLQNQCLSLLKENGELSCKLLEFIKGKICHIQDVPGLGQDVNDCFDGYSVLEYDMKLQSFNRRVENLQKSLQMTSAALQDKSELDAFESSSQSIDIVTSTHPKVLVSEHDVELDLKAEVLLTRVLREKLCYKELEFEQLQAELATSVRGHDILRSENQRAQDAISSLTHKTKHLEFQMLKKDESVNQTLSDLQECMKELTTTRGILQKVTQERELMWEEVKQYSEKSMLLDYEVNTMRKKIESLEEDVLLKEGQITILKDSLENKPFDILCSQSLKEFTLE